VRLVWSAIFLSLALQPNSASAQPFVFYRGVLNAASFVPSGLPGGSIARGSIFSIFGRDLGPAAGVQVSAFPLADELGGVSVEICQDDACAAAIPLFVRADQINAILPSDAPLGPASLRVSFDGQAGNFTPIEIVESSVGLFSVNSGGFGPGVLQNFVSQESQPVNSALAAARPGQVVTLWATGLGPGLNADNLAPQPGDLPFDVEIWVGAARVTRKLYSGRSPCCAGVDQIVFEIPADAPQGCYAPVHVRTAGRTVSNSVTIAISDQDQCSDPQEPSVAALRAGGDLAAFFVRRGRRRNPAGGTTIYDLASASFGAETGGPWAYNPNYVSPPPGACRVSARRGALFETTAVYGAVPSGGALDAGPRLTASTGRGARALGPRLGPHPGYLGDLGPHGQDAETILEPGATVRISGPGGADVAAFAVELQLPEPPTWNLEQTEVDRSRPLNVSWSGGQTGDQIWLVGGAADPVHDAAVIFSCPAPDGATAFTIGPEILSRVPQAAGFLSVSSRRRGPDPSSTAGLDGGDASAGAGTSLEVSFR